MKNIICTTAALSALLTAGLVGCGDNTGTTSSTATGGGSVDVSAGGNTGGGDVGGMGGDVGGSGGDGGQGGEVDPNSVDIVRDDLGVAHVYGGSENAAMYGLGYATAEDRLFQMELHRRYMRGRLAETFGGAGTPLQRRIDHDTRIRTLGFARHAETILDNPNFDAATKARLEAYAAGVNAFVNASGFTLPASFTDAGIDTFEPWTAADSLLAWERIRETFNQTGMQKELDELLTCESGTCTTAICEAPVDDSAAVVPETTPWPPADRTACYKPKREIAKEVEFKASHGWAVSGARSTTGKPILAMDPKLKVAAPSMLHNIHVSWPGVSARGLAMAGAPGFLIFWNEHVAQTLTAGAADVSDLYELTLNGDGSAYTIDGVEHAFDERTEQILVKDGSPIEITIRVTSLGPVVTDLLQGAPGGREFALRHIDLEYDDTHSMVGVTELISADDLASYTDAMGKWLTPTANAVFATDDGPDGHIGYSLIGAVPWRVGNVVQGTDWQGQIPYDGSNSGNDWSGHLSVNERPHIIDPPEGYIFSANHLPVGTWFSDYAYIGNKTAGDTGRSFHLRKMFEAELPNASDKMTVDDVHAMHFDDGFSFVHTFRDMLAYLRTRSAIADAAAPSTVATTQAEKGGKVLDAIDAWIASGGDLRHSNPLLPIAQGAIGHMPAQMRIQAHPEMACAYNGASTGWAALSKAFAADPNGTMSNPDVPAFLLDETAVLWDMVVNVTGSQDYSSWTAPGTTPDFTVGYQSSWYCVETGQGACSLDTDEDLTFGIDAPFGSTILSTSSSIGTGTIDFSDVDSSRHLVPMGASEDPGSTSFESGATAWLEADAGNASSTPNAPLSREAVDAIAVSTETLTYMP